MGRPVQRMSINAENPESHVSVYSEFKMWSHIPPCTFAMMLKAEGAMQRALTSLSHVPWIGIHSSSMSRTVTMVTTAKNAMRMYVYLWNSRCVGGTRRKTKRHTETLTRNVPML